MAHAPLPPGDFSPASLPILARLLHQSLLNPTEARVLELVETRHGYVSGICALLGGGGGGGGGHLPPEVRQVAAIAVRNAVRRNWHAAAPDCVPSAEERRAVRPALVELACAEEDARVFSQLVLALAKIARVDWSRDWPDAIEDLVGRLGAALRLLPSAMPPRGAAHAYNPAAERHFARTLTLLGDVLGELDSKRLAADRRRFRDVAEALLPCARSAWGVAMRVLAVPRLAALAAAVKGQIVSDGGRAALAAALQQLAPSLRAAQSATKLATRLLLVAHHAALLPGGAGAGALEDIGGAVAALLSARGPLHRALSPVPVRGSSPVHAGDDDGGGDDDGDDGEGGAALRPLDKLTARCVESSKRVTDEHALVAAACGATAAFAAMYSDAAMPGAAAGGGAAMASPATPPPPAVLRHMLSYLTRLLDHAQTLEAAPPPPPPQQQHAGEPFDVDVMHGGATAGAQRGPSSVHGAGGGGFGALLQQRRAGSFNASATGATTLVSSATRAAALDAVETPDTRGDGAAAGGARAGGHDPASGGGRAAEHRERGAAALVAAARAVFPPSAVPHWLRYIVTHCLAPGRHEVAEWDADSEAAAIVGDVGGSGGGGGVDEARGSAAVRAAGQALLRVLILSDEGSAAASITAVLRHVGECERELLSACGDIVAAAATAAAAATGVSSRGAAAARDSRAYAAVVALDASYCAFGLVVGDAVACGVLQEGAWAGWASGADFSAILVALGGAAPLLPPSAAATAANGDTRMRTVVGLLSSASPHHPLPPAAVQVSRRVRAASSLLLRRILWLLGACLPCATSPYHRGAIMRLCVDALAGARGGATQQAASGGAAPPRAAGAHAGGDGALPMGVRLAAAATATLLVEELNMGGGAPSDADALLSPAAMADIAGAVYSAVAAAREMETRLQLLSLLSAALPRCRAAAVLASIPALLPPLPALWAASADANLVRKHVLGTMIAVVGAATEAGTSRGRNGDDGSGAAQAAPPELWSSVLPLIAASVVGPSALYLGGEGCELWDALLEGAPAYSSEAHALLWLLPRVARGETGGESAPVLASILGGHVLRAGPALLLRTAATAAPSHQTHHHHRQHHHSAAADSGGGAAAVGDAADALLAIAPQRSIATVVRALDAVAAAFGPSALSVLGAAVERGVVALARGLAERAACEAADDRAMRLRRAALATAFSGGDSAASSTGSPAGGASVVMAATTPASAAIGPWSPWGRRDDAATLVAGIACASSAAATPLGDVAATAARNALADAVARVGAARAHAGVGGAVASKAPAPGGSTDPLLECAPPTLASAADTAVLRGLALIAARCLLESPRDFAALLSRCAAASGGAAPPPPAAAASAGGVAPPQTPPAFVLGAGHRHDFVAAGAIAPELAVLLAALDAIAAAGEGMGAASAAAAARDASAMLGGVRLLVWLVDVCLDSFEDCGGGGGDADGDDGGPLAAGAVSLWHNKLLSLALLAALPLAVHMHAAAVRLAGAVAAAAAAPPLTASLQAALSAPSIDPLAATAGRIDAAFTATLATARDVEALLADAAVGRVACAARQPSAAAYLEGGVGGVRSVGGGMPGRPGSGGARLGGAARALRSLAAGAIPPPIGAPEPEEDAWLRGGGERGAAAAAAAAMSAEAATLRRAAFLARPEVVHDVARAANECLGQLREALGAGPYEERVQRLLPPAAASQLQGRTNDAAPAGRPQTR